MGGLVLMGGGLTPSSVPESLALAAAFVSSINIAGAPPPSVSGEPRRVVGLRLTHPWVQVGS